MTRYPVPRDPDTNFGTRRFSKRVGGVAAALLSCIMLFNLVVPSKARVDNHDARLQSIESKFAQDHDAIIKLGNDVDYIRKWVERQERDRLRLVRPYISPATNQPPVP